MNVDEHIGADAVYPDDFSSEKLEANNKSGVGVNGNLRPATAGEVRNPKGRPPGSRNRSTIVKEWLEMQTEGEDNLSRVMRALIKKASEGDVPAIKETLDSAFGKLTDKVGGDPEAPIVHTVKWGE